MSRIPPVLTPGALAGLRRLRERPGAAGICDLCAAPIETEHQHLLETATRNLECACEACAILLSSPDAARYRRVPRRVRFLSGFRIDDGLWEALDIPIGIAFLVRRSGGEIAAVYPSPGGPIESAVPGDSWARLVEANPGLEAMEEEVEGLLVYRIGEVREYFQVPLDRCYALAGLVRKHWKGLSGGSDVWEAVARFREALDAAST